MTHRTRSELERDNAKVQRTWAKRAASYDKCIGFFERNVFGTEHRVWACQRTSGKTLEIAVGTGLNLPHYPSDVSLTGMDLSPEMLEIARERALSLGLDVELVQGDAHQLDFGDNEFDTVLATYSLCNIPDPQRAVAEMKRTLRRDGKLILVDHIRSTVKPILWAQKAIELVTSRLEGEHMTRRPLRYVEAQGFEILEQQRMRAGIVERLLARPTTGSSRSGAKCQPSVSV
ncbi:MAG TPA: class I SAM-dependent methyltransferase [Actinomycetota bacterium]|nr:class I SAM-dependent methyltransferase [Actinomycetota bacterium]